MYTYFYFPFSFIFFIFLLFLPHLLPLCFPVILPLFACTRVCDSLSAIQSYRCNAFLLCCPPCYSRLVPLLTVRLRVFLLLLLFLLLPVSPPSTLSCIISMSCEDSLTKEHRRWWIFPALLDPPSAKNRVSCTLSIIYIEKHLIELSEQLYMHLYIQVIIMCMAFRVLAWCHVYMHTYV